MFKELLSTFFVEFLELFFTQLIAYLEPGSITFLDEEILTDVTAGDRLNALIGHPDGVTITISVMGLKRMPVLLQKLFQDEKMLEAQI